MRGFSPVALTTVGRVVRSRAMAKRESRHRFQLALGAVAIVPAFLCSCGSTGASPAASKAATDASVIAGWKAALNAVDTAARTGDAMSVNVAKTHVEPEFSIVKSNLESERAADAVAIGHDRILSVEVEKLSGMHATVIACVNGGEIIVNALTHDPVAGVLGQAGFESFMSILLKTRGGWKVERQTVVERRCEA